MQPAGPERAPARPPGNGGGGRALALPLEMVLGEAQRFSREFYADDPEAKERIGAMDYKTMPAGRVFAPASLGTAADVPAPDDARSWGYLADAGL